MSAFLNGFNPLIDRYDRRSAARLFQGLWPDADISLACAKALAASIHVAHEAADACWGATMFPDMLRLNVGQVEVLTLTADEVKFLFKAPLDGQADLPFEIRVEDDPVFAAVPIASGVCFVPTADLASLPLTVRQGHDTFICAAASYKRISPFKKSFSPAVLEHLEAALGLSMPRPSYLPQQAVTLPPRCGRWPART